MIPIYPENFPNIDQNGNTVVIFQSINDHNYGEQWRRTGSCNQCGECCVDTENVFANMDGDYNPGGLTQVVPGMCAYFRWDENGLGTCTGRDTKFYKSGCIGWPSKIEHVLPWSKCGYKFEKIS